MKKSKTEQVREDMRTWGAARRRAEIASGIRTDRRFVGKTIPDKRRKTKNKQARRELCEGREHVNA